MGAVVYFRHGRRAPLQSVAQLPEPPWTRCTLPPAVQGACLTERQHRCLRQAITDRDGLGAPLAEKLNRVKLTVVDGESEDSITSCTARHRRTVHGGGGERLIPAVSPRLNGSRGDCHVGELTVDGVQDAMALGRLLRRRYVHHIPLLNDADGSPRLYLRSSNVSRTLTSLHAVLTELLGEAAPRLHATVWSKPVEDEFIFPNRRSCARLFDLFRDARAQYDDAPGASVVALRRRLSGVLSIPEKDINFIALHDIVTSRAAAGQPLPIGLDTATVRDISRAATLQIRGMVRGGFDKRTHKPHNGREGLRLSIGRLLEHSRQHILRLAESPQRGARLVVYSGHDTTLMPLLEIFAPQELHEWPPCSSWVAIELFADLDKGQPAGREAISVRVVFNGRNITPGDTRDGCMRLEELLAMIQPLIPRNYSTECRSRASERPTPTTAADGTAFR